MSKVVFVKQDIQHSNPTSVKIKNSFIKKSKAGQQKITSHINASNTTTLQSDSGYKQTLTTEQHSYFNLKESHAITTFHQHREEERNASPTEKKFQQNSFLMGRNKELQELLKRKNQKIETLDRRCEKLQMRLLAQSRKDSPKNSSSLNNRVTKIRFSVSTVEDRKSRIEKLKSIRSRLKQIDFSRALGSGSFSHSQEGKKP